MLFGNWGLPPSNFESMISTRSQFDETLLALYLSARFKIVFVSRSLVLQRFTINWNKCQSFVGTEGTMASPKIVIYMPLVWHSSHFGAVAKHCFERVECCIFNPRVIFLNQFYFLCVKDSKWDLKHIMYAICLTQFTPWRNGQTLS